MGSPVISTSKRSPSAPKRQGEIRVAARYGLEVLVPHEPVDGRRHHDLASHEALPGEALGRNVAGRDRPDG